MSIPKQDDRRPGSGYAEIETEVRKIAMSLPPSDFGSTRAIQAVAQWVSENFTPNCNAYTSTDALRSALAELYHAVCGVNGFANAVREISGIAYPWPALDIAEEKARAALAGSTHASDCAVHNEPALPSGECDCGVSGSPAPSPDIEELIDAAYEYTMNSQSISSSPAPSTEGLREWQPIETAPKDGTSILACVAGASVPVIAKWVVTPRHGKWVAADEDDFDSMEDWAEYVSAHDFPATHWMPLPPAPDAARAALAGSTHASDCAVHNEPALPSGECDCGVSGSPAPSPDIEELIDAAYEYTMNSQSISSSPAPSTEGLREALAPFAKLHDEILFCAGPNDNPDNWCKSCAWPDLKRAKEAYDALAGVTAPTTRSFNEHMVEDLIVAAYKRGFIWANHNPVDGEFLDKAARDYADYTMNAPSAGVTDPSEVEGK
jgi:hypothetical protein